MALYKLIIHLSDLTTRARDTKDAKYSRLSLSRPRISRITAYLEVKIWSLL